MNQGTYDNCILKILVIPYHCELIWVEAAANGCIPTGAIKDGYNNGDDLYIGRAPLE